MGCREDSNDQKRPAAPCSTVVDALSASSCNLPLNRVSASAEEAGIK